MFMRNSFSSRRNRQTRKRQRERLKQLDEPDHACDQVFLAPSKAYCSSTGWLLNTSNCVRSIASAVADNLPVISFHDSCGLERVASLPRHFELAGVTYDGVKQMCMRENWPIVRSRLEVRAERIARLLNRGSARRPRAQGNAPINHSDVRKLRRYPG